MARLVGPAGATSISAGTLPHVRVPNLVILVSPRVYQAMAEDGACSFRRAFLRSCNRRPYAAAAIVFQAAWRWC